MSEPLRGERAVLVDYLDHFREVFAAKCEGLDAGQLAARSVPPSSMSLLGLLAPSTASRSSSERPWCT